jgi:hypothetical protein
VAPEHELWGRLQQQQQSSQVSSVEHRHQRNAGFRQLLAGALQVLAAAPAIASFNCTATLGSYTHLPTLCCFPACLLAPGVAGAAGALQQ